MKAMKKIYITPHLNVIVIEAEQTLLTESTDSGLTIDSGGGSITDESGFGTNKKQHPIWGTHEENSPW